MRKARPDLKLITLCLSPELRTRLLALSHTDNWQADELAGLDIAFSELSAKVVERLLEKSVSQQRHYRHSQSRTNRSPQAQLNTSLHLSNWRPYTVSFGYGY